MKCTYCEGEYFSNTKSNFPIEINGELVQIKAKIKKCDNCKNIFLEKDQMNRMRIKAAKKYKLHHWLTSSKIIKGLIKKYEKNNTPLHIVLGIEKKELKSYTQDKIQPIEVEFLLRNIISGMKRNYINCSSAKRIPVDMYWISGISRIDKIPLHTPFIACVQDSFARTKVTLLYKNSWEEDFRDIWIAHINDEEEKYWYEKKDIIAWMPLPENVHSKELDN